MAIRYKNPQTGEYEVIKIPVMRGEQGHSGIHVGTDAPPTTDVKLWFDPSDTENDVDLANRLDSTLTACYDYMGNDRGSIKKAADANVEYVLGEVNTVHYEGKHITATDTIEKQVKSAILKGQTLVNLIEKENDKVISNYESGNILLTGHQNIQLKASTKYTFIFKASNVSSANKNGMYQYQGSTTGNTFYKYNIGTHTMINGLNYLVFTPPVDIKQINFLSYGTFLSGGGCTIHGGSFILLEGDYTNVDIPYFEGMQSVRMPVLKTTGKNLFNEKYQNLSDFTYDEDGIQLKTNKRLVFQNPVKIQANKTYIGLIEYSGGCASRGMGFNDVNQKGLYPTYGVPVVNSSEVKVKQVKFTPTSDTYLVSIHNGFDHDGVLSPKIHKVAIFESSNINESYEPFKSNILTVNEDVTLRGIGDVRDELDLITGELVQRVGQETLIVDNWVAQIGDYENNFVYRYQLDTNKIEGNHGVICDTQPVYPVNWDFPQEGLYVYGYTVYISIDKNLNPDASTLETFKNNWAPKNPITVQYLLKEKSIKTVDLSDNHVYSYKDVTHYDCSSAEGSLVPTLSIDVPTNLSALVTKQRQQIRTLEEENKELNQELELAIASSEENDNELLAQSFELDFRLMEVEFALDLPMAATFRLGGKAMAMTPYEMAKKLILADNYDRADMEHKLEVYVSKKRMTEAERQELIQLMDEKEGVITIDPVEPEVEETVIEHEAVTIPLH